MLASFARPYSACQACDVVITVFTCIRTVWNRVRNMFATVLTTITTIWRPWLKIEAFQDYYTCMLFFNNGKLHLLMFLISVLGASFSQLLGRPSRLWQMGLHVGYIKLSHVQNMMENMILTSYLDKSYLVASWGGYVASWGGYVASIQTMSRDKLKH